MQHSFDIAVAQKYNVNIAIFLNNLAFWVQKNMANERNLHDGRYWTYNSVKAYSTLFPYWTTKQVRTVINSCLDLGLIIQKNFNKSTYDRTHWYTLSDLGHEITHLPIWANGVAQMGTPIPDINTYTKQDIKSLCANDKKMDNKFDNFWNLYPKKKDKQRSKKIWIKKKLDDIADQLVNDVSNRLNNDQDWIKDNGRYIPKPSNYLEHELWTDEITPPNDFYQTRAPKKESSVELALRMCLPQSKRV